MFGKKQPKTEIKFHSTEELELEIKDFKFENYPTSTTLTPHELYLLLKCGYEPIQIVFGNVVYSMGIGGVFRTIMRALSRGEMVDFSRLNKDARLLARNRMVDEARKIGGVSVLGVKIETKETADFMEVVATGTAVRRTHQIVAEEPVSVGV